MLPTFDEELLEIAKLQLHLPLFAYESEIQPLCQSEMQEVVETLKKGQEPVKLDSLIVAHGDCAEGDAKVEELRKKIHEDFDGTVLREDLIPNPPPYVGGMGARTSLSRRGPCRKGKSLF
jgi:hypothetical protein